MARHEPTSPSPRTPVTPVTPVTGSGAATAVTAATRRSQSDVDSTSPATRTDAERPPARRAEIDELDGGHVHHRVERDRRR